MSYAWIIDKDHLAEPGAKVGTLAGDARTVTGPSDAPDYLIERLERGDRTAMAGVETFEFRMYDDDRELYYTGRMITDEGDTEAACAGPLDDFGRPNAGATDINYTDHPEMDIG